MIRFSNFRPSRLSPPGLRLRLRLRLGLFLRLPFLRRRRSPNLHGRNSGLGLAPALALVLAGPGFSGGPAAAQRIRIAAANISSGNTQSYDPGHGIRILKGTKPDIVLIQEFNYGANTAADLRGMVDAACGPSYQYYREGGPGSIPNGIISRFPILESGEWASPVAERDFAYARIDIPGDRELLAVSVHLPTTDGQRPNEASLLVAFIDSYYTANNNARATDYLVIGGDFNSDSRTETALNTLGQLVTIGTAWPVDRKNNSNTNLARVKPYDGVYAGNGLHALQTATVIGASTFPNGLVADTREYVPISEISPALATDSVATNMQHMAVIRDFQIPIPPDPPLLELLDSSILTEAPRQARITFRSTAGATYEVQASATPGSGAWANLGTIVAGGSSTAVTIVPGPPLAGEFRDPLFATAGRRFFRVIRR
ncbi:MAG: Endonuclease/exonuclease/phosphatase family [Verrucomicrobiales bacterium]|nr:Endonuclease/exonuclease/phosphatase family [Verrucomicrobiales bacterium]